MNDVERNSAHRVCSYCQLPPKDGGKKLKICSKCKKVWYHNAECQRKHWSLHKHDCKKWSTTVSKKSTPRKQINECSDKDSRRTFSSSLHKKFCVQEREGRGKCLVVSPGGSVRKGERIKNHERHQDFWEPLIRPVLHEEHRRSRCALCFVRLPSNRVSVYSFNQVPQKSLYRLLFCSAKCLQVASQMDFEQEEQDCREFLQRIQGLGQKPRRIYSTAILLYRILICEHRQRKDDTHIRDHIRALQSKQRRESSYSDDISNVETDVDYHTQGIIAIAMGMLQCSKNSISSQYCPSMDHLSEMVHRIKVNGFSIFYENTFETCGVGLYSTPSFMNHACRANALQTFLFRQGHPPALYVTAFRDIAPNQEICISYIDTSCPSHMRRQQLQKEYHFDCICDACDNNSSLQDDVTTMSIRCTDCCKKQSSPLLKQSSVIRVDKGLNPRRSIYQCLKCKSSDFESVLRQLQRFEEKVPDRRLSSVTSSKELQTIYQKIQTICHSNSWYVQEAGDQLLQSHLDNLPSLVGDPIREQRVARAALKLAEELLGNPQSPSMESTNAAEILSTSLFLKQQHLRHTVAKLRLFLVPDPRQSIQELQEILSSLRPYFSESHAIMVGLKETLASAMM